MIIFTQNNQSMFIFRRSFSRVPGQAKFLENLDFAENLEISPEADQAFQEILRTRAPRKSLTPKKVIITKVDKENVDTNFFFLFHSFQKERDLHPKIGTVKNLIPFFEPFLKQNSKTW